MPCFFQFTTKCLFFCFVYFRSMCFFTYQLLYSHFMFPPLSLLLVVAPSFQVFFPLFPLPLLLLFYRLFSYASIINLCGPFVFSKFVQLFLAFFSVGLLCGYFIHLKDCLVYATGMCMYYWSIRLMVVFFLRLLDCETSFPFFPFACQEFVFKIVSAVFSSLLMVVEFVLQIPIFIYLATLCCNLYLFFSWLALLIPVIHLFVFTLSSNI